MIPAGTGFHKHRKAELRKRAAAPELPESSAEEEQAAMVS